MHIVKNITWHVEAFRRIGFSIKIENSHFTNSGTERTLSMNCNCKNKAIGVVYSGRMYNICKLNPENLAMLSKNVSHKGICELQSNE